MNKLNRLGEHIYQPNFSDAIPLEIGEYPSAHETSKLEDLNHGGNTPTRQPKKKKKKKKKKETS